LKEKQQGHTLCTRKGLAKCLVDADIEAFYVLEGCGTIEVESERLPLGANEAISLDLSKLHSLVNAGEAKTRYMVVIARP
jgi:mannose-6-phosphate isomerase-like protein (cupin superfamily)